MRGSSSGTSALSSTRRSVPRLGHRGQDLDAGVAAGVARGRRRSARASAAGTACRLLGVLVAPVGRGQPVDGRQEVEERQAGRPGRDLRGGGPGLGGDADPEALAGRGCSCSTSASPRCSANVASSASRRSSVGGASSAGASASAGGPRRSRCRQPTTIGSPRVSPVQRLAMSSFWMRSWSITMPSSSASGRGGQPGHVDVDGHDLVDALGDRVAVPVRAAAVGARAHRDHVLRVGHLLVEAPDGRDDLVRDGAGDDHQVRLAGAGRERDHAEAHHVVAGRGQGGAHLDGAARQAPLVGPDGVLAAQVEELGERLRHLAALDEAHQRRPLLRPT